ncbi:MAG: hypothetical protein LUE19_09015 [Clostridiales bacterium]|nr:hypothetical protein [Clostridiales bacterium]
MQTIEKYIEALENKDFYELGELFTKDGLYIDYSAFRAGEHEYYLYGKEAISMFFRNKFHFCKYSILEPAVLNNRQAEFIAQFDNHSVMAIVILQQISEDGHIRRLTVRPK